MSANCTRMWIVKLQKTDPEGSRLLDAGITNNLKNGFKTELVRVCGALVGVLAAGRMTRTIQTCNACRACPKEMHAPCLVYSGAAKAQEPLGA